MGTRYRNRNNFFYYDLTYIYIHIKNPVPAYTRVRVYRNTCASCGTCTKKGTLLLGVDLRGEVPFFIFFLLFYSSRFLSHHVLVVLPLVENVEDVLEY